MDPVKILKRSWHILWNYRALWVFGLILALTAAGSSGGNGNNGSRYGGDTGNQRFETPLPENWREEAGKAFEDAGKGFSRILEEGLPSVGITGSEVTTLLWIGAAFILVMMLVGLVMAVARYVSETAVIRMVDKYEDTETKLTVREGFHIGWSRTSWRLFLIDLIVNIPGFILLAVLLIAGFVIYTMVTGRSEPFEVAGMVGLIGLVILVIFVVAILSIFLHLLRQFFWRVCALEDMGVMDSLRQGFQMVRENWKDVGLMWLIMVGLGIAWMIVSAVAVILTIPVVVITTIIAIAVAIVPGMLLVGLFSLFLSGYLPWVAGALFIAPLFFTLAFSPWVLLTAWQQIYAATVWTLTYREIKVLPALQLETDIGPVGD